MTTIVTREVGATAKGSPLTNAEVDSNFINLNTNKVETADFNVLERPSIRPSLLLDFANTKQLDPRITFTRASTATYYDGVTQAKAEENLIVNSANPFSGTSGGTTNNGDGTYTLTSASQWVYRVRDVETLIGTQFTVSVTLSGTGVVRLTGLTGSGAPTGYDVEVTLTATPTRYSWTGTNNTTGVNNGPLVRGAADNSPATVRTEKWQMELRGQVTAYTPTTDQPITKYQPVLRTAASGVPRFDHNPVTGESLGLLIEEPRTNLLLQSQQLDAAEWVRTNMTVLANYGVAPDGSVSADLLIGGTSLDAKSTYLSPTVSSGVSYTFSVYAKAAGTDYVILRYQATNFPNIAIRFSLTDGTTSPISGHTAPTSSSAKYVGNGWYRLTITSTATGAGVAYPTVSLSKDTASYAYTGDGYSGIYIWGAQLEAGSFPTSYIPTIAAQLTRAGDAASMTGTNFSSWYRQDEGTLYEEGTTLKRNTDPNSRFTSSITDGLSNFIMGLRYTTAVNPMVYYAGVTQVSLVTLNPYQNDAFHKNAIAVKQNDFATSTNGLAAVSDSSGSLPMTVNTLSIGLYGNVYLCGHIKKLAYYPKRLSNTELQVLTA